MAKTFKDSRDDKRGVTFWGRSLKRQKEDAQQQRRARISRKDAVRRAALEELLSVEA